LPRRYLHHFQQNGIKIDHSPDGCFTLPCGMQHRPNGLRQSVLNHSNVGLSFKSHVSAKAEKNDLPVIEVEQSGTGLK